MPRKNLIAPALTVLTLMGTAASAHAAPTFTVVTVPSGVQALRDGGPSTWWLSGITFVDLDHDGEPLGDPPRIRITGRWILDSRWITRHWIPGLGRCIPMTCSFLLEPSL